MKYGPNGEKVITNLKRVSKPGLRVYSKREDIPKVLNGLGIAIISTSEGLLTDKQARQRTLVVSYRIRLVIFSFQFRHVPVLERLDILKYGLRRSALSHLEIET